MSFPTVIEGGEKYLNKGRIRNFTDIETLEPEYDGNGNFIPLQERITEEQNVFHDSGIKSDFTDGQRVIFKLALKRLTEKQRQVLDYLEYDGMSERVTAKKLNISQQVVHKHYKAALKKLKKLCLDK